MNGYFNSYARQRAQNIICYRYKSGQACKRQNWLRRSQEEGQQPGNKIPKQQAPQRNKHQKSFAQECCYRFECCGSWGLVYQPYGTGRSGQYAQGVCTEQESARFRPISQRPPSGQERQPLIGSTPRRLIDDAKRMPACDCSILFA